MTLAETLRAVIERATPDLLALDEAVVSTPREADAWTPKEIIGHLIDSACNNHARFVRAQGVDHLDFQGYDGEAWVEAGRYDAAEWTALVDLWGRYNLHIAHVVAHTPSEVMSRARALHSLDRIAWRAVPSDQSTTLGYFVNDYIGHLEHHLGQILPGYRPLSIAGAVQ